MFIRSEIIRESDRAILVVIWMFVTPLPIIALLSAIVLLEGDAVSAMFVAILLVGTRFAVIPIVVVLVVAIVNADAYNLRRRVRTGCKRCHERGRQKQSS